MTRVEIEKQLIQLQKELDENNIRYNDIEDDIRDLESELQATESISNAIHDKITNLKLTLQKLSNSELTGDKFKDAFIKCSWLCHKNYSGKYALSYVNILDDKMFATDGHKGIVIKCDTIPDQLKNTFVHWDVRDNFEEHIVRNLQSPDIIKIIKDNKAMMKEGFKCKVSDFYKLQYKEDVTDDRHIVYLQYKDVKVAFDKVIIDSILSCFDNNITVYFPISSVTPMIITNSEQATLMMPMRSSNL